MYIQNCFCAKKMFLATLFLEIFLDQFFPFEDFFGQKYSLKHILAHECFGDFVFLTKIFYETFFLVESFLPKINLDEKLVNIFFLFFCGDIFGPIFFNSMIFLAVNYIWSILSAKIFLSIFRFCRKYFCM